MSHSTLNQKKPTRYLAIDIERTGAGPCDLTFAIGYAIGSLFDDEVKKGRLCLDLGKEKNETFAELWERRRFNDKTYEEFWSKHLSVLEFLQQPSNTLFHDELKFVQAFVDVIHEEHNKGNRLVILTDTVHFDTCYIDELLKKYGYAPLHRSPTGEYVSGCDVSSFVEGVARCSPLMDWSLKKVLCHRVSHHFIEGLDNNHDPADDAHNILAHFITTVKGLPENSNADCENLHYYLQQVLPEHRAVFHHIRCILQVYKNQRELIETDEKGIREFNGIIQNFSDLLTKLCQTREIRIQLIRSAINSYKTISPKTLLAPFQNRLLREPSEKLRIKVEQDMESVTQMLKERQFFP